MDAQHAAWSHSMQYDCTAYNLEQRRRWLYAFYAFGKGADGVGEFELIETTARHFHMLTVFEPRHTL